MTPMPPLRDLRKQNIAAHDLPDADRWQRAGMPLLAQTCRDHAQLLAAAALRDLLDADDAGTGAAAEPHRQRVPERTQGDTGMKIPLLHDTAGQRADCSGGHGAVAAEWCGPTTAGIGSGTNRTRHEWLRTHR